MTNARPKGRGPSCLRGVRTVFSWAAHIQPRTAFRLSASTLPVPSECSGSGVRSLRRDPLGSASRPSFQRLFGKSPFAAPSLKGTLGQTRASCSHGGILGGNVALLLLSTSSPTPVKYGKGMCLR